MKDWRKAFWTCLALVPLILSTSSEFLSPEAGVSMALTLIFVGALPLLATAIFWSPPSFETDPLLRFGRSRRGLARRFLLKKIIVLFTVAAAMGTLAQMTLYGDASGPSSGSEFASSTTSSSAFLSDAASTLPVALAAAVSLACFFAFAHSWLGKPGLIMALLGSWLFTPHDSLWGLSLPANHIRHLLALGTPLPLPSWASLLALYAMAALLFAFYMKRVPE